MSTKTAIISGGAGFIGVNLFKKIKEKYEKVVCIDNFSLGKYNFLSEFVESNKLEIIRADCSNKYEVKKIVKELEENNCYGDIWHLAANSDIPSGVKNAEIDLKDTFMTTFNIVSAMENSSFKTIFFASSSAIYGDHKDKLLNENVGPLMPISNYGAMKLSSEAIICSAAEAYLERAVIFRFPNVVGTPATHGVIYDFTEKLFFNNKQLEVLGDGSQKKSYLHVNDLIDGMVSVWNSWPNKKKIDIFNIGPKDEGIFVRDIAHIVSKNFGSNIKIIYGKGNRGWLGDVPRFIYDTSKISKLVGWKPRLSSREAIEKASKEILFQFKNNKKFH